MRQGMTKPIPPHMGRRRVQAARPLFPGGRIGGGCFGVVGAGGWVRGCVGAWVRGVGGGHPPAPAPATPYAHHDVLCTWRRGTDPRRRAGGHRPSPATPYAQAHLAALLSGCPDPARA